MFSLQSLLQPQLSQLVDRCSAGRQQHRWEVSFQLARRSPDRQEVFAIPPLKSPSPLESDRTFLRNFKVRTTYLQSIKFVIWQFLRIWKCEQFGRVSALLSNPPSSVDHWLNILPFFPSEAVEGARYHYSCSPCGSSVKALAFEMRDVGFNSRQLSTLTFVHRIFILVYVGRLSFQSRSLARSLLDRPFPILRVLESTDRRFWAP